MPSRTRSCDNARAVGRLRALVLARLVSSDRIEHPRDGTMSRLARRHPAGSFAVVVLAALASRLVAVADAGPTAPCPAYFTTTSGTQREADTNNHQFRRGNGVYYVRADVTTPSASWSSTQTIFLWGATSSVAYGCGGLRGGLTTTGYMYMDVQCNHGTNDGTSNNVNGGSVPINEDFGWVASLNTRYELVYVYDSATQRTKFFVDGVEITPSGGSTVAKLYPFDGHISVGYNEHSGSTTPTAFEGGTVHEISFHDCPNCVVPSAPADGGDGTCTPGTDMLWGEQCVPTCADPDAIPAPTRCNEVGALTPGSCLCACAEKMARFGFIFGNQTRVYP